eukprot:UN03627
MVHRYHMPHLVLVMYHRHQNQIPHHYQMLQVHRRQPSHARSSGHNGPSRPLHLQCNDIYHRTCKIHYKNHHLQTM